MHWIPQSWSHLHILVSVFPSVGLVFVLGFYVTSVLARNEAMKRTCLVLFVVLGLFALPTYLSGDRSMAVFAANPQSPKDVMNIHFWWGLAGLAILVLTGVAAVYELWQSRQSGKMSDQALNLVLVLAIATLVVMSVVDDYGFEINHHELRLGSAAVRGVSTPQAWSFVHMVLNHFP